MPAEPPETRDQGGNGPPAEGSSAASPRPLGWIDLARESPFRLGPLHIEPALRRITHDDGREMILEPRVMQVFVALASVKGGILTHDDLAACCWKGRFVSADAMNRVLSALRRTAGELGAGVFKIETLRKVGYRLLLEPEAAAPPPRDAGIQSRGEPAHGARSWTSPRRTAGRITIALAAVGAVAVLYAGGRALGLGGGGTLISRGEVAPRDQLLVADFANRTRDPVLGQAVAQALAIDLARSKLIRVVDATEAAAALKRMDRSPSGPLTPDLARELAVREGIEAVLEGSVSSLGPKTLVHARLVSPRSGQVLAEAQETANNSEALLPVVDELSATLRRKIGEARAVLRAEPPLEQVTTSSLEALRLYTQAARATDLAGEDEKAVILLRQALDVDPKFASAWWRLGMALQSQQNRPAQTRFALAQAYAHRARMTERERGLMLGTYHRFVAHDMKASVAAYEALVAAYPDDAKGIRYLGSSHMALGNFAAAEALTRRALALDDSEPRVYRMLVQHLANQGKFEQGESVYQTALRRFPTSSKVIEGGYYLSLAAKNFDAAELRARRLQTLKPGDPFLSSLSAWHLGLVAATEGRLEDAAHRFEEAARVDAREGLAASAAENLIGVADVELLRGRPARARAVLQESVARFPPARMEPAERPYWLLAEAFAKAGAPAEARAYMLQARKEQLMEPFWSHRFADRVDGLIALAEGRPSDAARLLHGAVGGECEICSLLELGRAYEAVGRRDRALWAYERYVSRPSVYRDHWLGPAYERLAALHAQSGDPRRAAHYATQLAALWKQADPELQARARAAQPRTPTVSRTALHSAVTGRP